MRRQLEYWVADALCRPGVTQQLLSPFSWALGWKFGMISFCKGITHRSIVSDRQFVNRSTAG